MKKQITALILVFVFFLSMSGCMTAKALDKLETAEERVEEQLDAVEDQLEAKRDSVVAPTEKMPVRESAAAAEQETQAAVPSVTEKVQLLSREEAQQIALDYVGLSVDQVTRLHTEYEIDDRIPQYDVEFHQGNLEYEFEIHAETGTILSFDKDYD